MVLSQFWQALMITSFVMVMMLIIEYVNVYSRGKWAKHLQHNSRYQIILGALMGILPGCLGTYAVVSLYTHNIIQLPALVAALIATSGDEAYIMFSMIPDTALKITLFLLLIGIAAGYLTKFIFPSFQMKKFAVDHLHIHQHEQLDNALSLGSIAKQWRNISFSRAILVFAILVFITALLSGKFVHGHAVDETHQISIEHNHAEHEHDHDHEHDHAHDMDESLNTIPAHPEGFDWLTVTFIVLSFLALFVVIVVPEHFIQEHLWGHVIKKHFLKILAWTFVALLGIAFLLNHFDLHNWLKDNQLWVVLVAVLIGFIPVSGPHMIFITLFFNNTIPFSVLLANSVVQDGHGALPLFAESKRSFMLAKVINMCAGLLVGSLGYFFNF